MDSLHVPLHFQAAKHHPIATLEGLKILAASAVLAPLWCTTPISLVYDTVWYGHHHEDLAVLRWLEVSVGPLDIWLASWVMTAGASTTMCQATSEQLGMKTFARRSSCREKLGGTWILDTSTSTYSTSLFSVFKCQIIQKISKQHGSVMGSWVNSKRGLESFLRRGNCSLPHQ